MAIKQLKMAEDVSKLEVAVVKRIKTDARLPKNSSNILKIALMAKNSSTAQNGSKRLRKGSGYDESGGRDHGSPYST